MRERLKNEASKRWYGSESTSIYEDIDDIQRLDGILEGLRMVLDFSDEEMEDISQSMGPAPTCYGFALTQIFCLRHIARVESRIRMLASHDKAPQ